ncbi:MAG: hypothetical protein ACYCY6_01285 [Minisyncoccota bacterium]
MTSLQLSQGASTGTTLNARARKKSNSGETSQVDIGLYVGHVRSLAEARVNRQEWKPGPDGRSKLSMEKEICSIWNIDLKTFHRLVTMAGRLDGPGEVRCFFRKRLDDPNLSLQEYIDSRNSIKGV